MSTPSLHTRILPIAAAILGLSAMACGGGHRLAEFNFEDRTMALVYLAPPSPGLLTGGYHLDPEDDVTELVVKATSGVAKDMEARRARARLDSAASRVDLEAGLAARTLERTSRYLGMRPVERTSDADFLLEVHLRSYGLDARGTTAAYLYSNAEVVLLERRTGHEVWNARVYGSDRMTPYVVGYEGIPGSIITAGTLHMVSVEDFQGALEQLVSFSSDMIATRLRSALRDVRRAN